MRYEITITGVVQGVGFRPFVAALAEELHISGSVCNSGGGGALDAEHIFERFYQGTKKEGSTGLGLSIVDAVCRLYGLRVGYSYINRCHCFSVHFRI